MKRKQVKEEGVVTITNTGDSITMQNEDGTIDIKQAVSDQVISLLANEKSKKFKYKVRGSFLEILGEVK